MRRVDPTITRLRLAVDAPGGGVDPTYGAREDGHRAQGDGAADEAYHARPGHVSKTRDNEGRAAGLLHPGRVGNAAAPQGPTAAHAPLPGGRRRAAVLAKGLSRAPAGVGWDRAG